MDTSAVRVQAIGDSAVVVTFADSLDLAANDSVHALDASLRHDPPVGVTELVPALATLLVRFDPLVVTHEELETDIVNRTGVSEEPRRRRHWTLPVVYGGEFGPDLDGVAAQIGGSTDDAVAAHQALRLRVLMIGFAPGFAYLGLAGPEWDVPRRDSVTPRVEPGTLLVAVRQTAVTGTATPTGWHAIGRTPVPTFDRTSEAPALLRAGDVVQFEAIAPDDFDRIRDDVAAGTYPLSPESP